MPAGYQVASVVEQVGSPAITRFPSHAPGSADSQPFLSRHGPQAAATAGLIIGAFWLAAWALSLPQRWTAAGFITVKTNMALGQFLAGVGLLLLLASTPGRVRRAVGVGAAAVVLLLGALTLSEHIFHYNLGIDQLLASEPAGAVATSSPNRMGLLGSASLALLGAGLLALAFRRRAIVPFLGLAVCLINFLPAVGFLYGIDQFYRLPRTGIAWPTVVAMLALGVGLVLACAERGPLAMLLRRDAGGALLRRLLPAMLAVPLVLGFLVAQGYHRGLHDSAMGTGMLVVAMVLLFSIFLWRSAARLSRSAAEEAQAQQALRKNQNLLEMFIRNAPAGLAMFDRDMRYLRVSDRWLQDTGIQDKNVPGRSHYDVFPNLPEHWKEAHRRALAGESLSGEDDWIALDGRKHTVRWEVHPWGDAGRETGGIIIFFEDITERRQAEAAMILAEKIASSARLAAVLAHEINNPLMAVSNLLYLLKGNASLDEGTQQLVSLAQQEVSRVGDITQRALNASRAKRTPEFVRPAAVMDDLLQLYSKNIQRKQVAVRKRYEFEGELFLDAGAIRQVLTNLLVNAVDALPQGGTLRLHVYDCCADGLQVVRIVVADNGTGIPAAYRDKLFQPFFTTKGAQGTGLGLWVTRGIIHSMGGTLRYRTSTRPGRSGTCFLVTLPMKGTADPASTGGS